MLQPLAVGGPVRSAHDRIDHVQKHQRRVERHAQDERHRQVAGQERGHHADGQHRQAHHPVAEVRAQEQTHVGLAQRVQHRQIAEQREQQRHAVNRHGRQILAQHHVEIGRRNRQQQLVGSLPLLVGPNAHRDRRDEHQHDVREPLIQLIEIRQIGVEELVGPERRERSQQHEYANEYVSRGIAEVADKIAAEDRANNVQIHGSGRCCLDLHSLRVS